MCPLNYTRTPFSVSGKVGIPFTGLTTSVLKLECPKSVCNRYVIEVVVTFLSCQVAFFEILFWV